MLAQQVPSSHKLFRRWGIFIHYLSHLNSLLETITYDYVYARDAEGGVAVRVAVLPPLAIAMDIEISPSLLCMFCALLCQWNESLSPCVMRIAVC